MAMLTQDARRPPPYCPGARERGHPRGRPVPSAQAQPPDRDPPSSRAPEGPGKALRRNHKGLRSKVPFKRLTFASGLRWGGRVRVTHHALPPRWSPRATCLPARVQTSPAVLRGLRVHMTSTEKQHKHSFQEPSQFELL